MGPLKLRRINVFDSTGESLFEKRWSWHGDPSGEGLGALVQSFYQFAREIDTGGIICLAFHTLCIRLNFCAVISRVQFELQAQPRQRQESRKHSKLLPSLMRDKTLLPPKEAIEMLCMKSGQIIVVGKAF